MKLSDYVTAPAKSVTSIVTAFVTYLTITIQAPRFMRFPFQSYPFILALGVLCAFFREKPNLFLL